MNLIKKMTKENSEKKTSAIINIVKGVITAIIFSIIALIIFSIILTNTELAESTINPIIMAITAISIFIGSIISVSKIEKKGIINGALVGLIYILFMYLLSSIINSNFSFNLNSVILIILATIAGMIGGIIGVNLKSKK